MYLISIRTIICYVTALLRFAVDVVMIAESEKELSNIKYANNTMNDSCKE